MRYLRFSVACFVLLSCASDYRYLQAVEPDKSCVDKFLPFKIETSWYNTSVDVVGKHLSGLLLIKNMPDHSQRVVFTNEAGVTFFDFGFLPDGTFKVYNIVKQMDKRPVIQTLRKDFELILGIPFRQGNVQRWSLEDDLFYGVKQKNETAYFITSKDCASLRRLEWGSTRKRMVTAALKGENHHAPDSIEIKHHTFNMQIKLIRFEKE